MQKQIYPVDQVADSIEAHMARHSRKSQAIYLTVVLSVLALLAALPVVRVPVSIQSGGIIRPLTEKHDVTLGTSGLVEAVLTRENQAVRRGQVLVRLRAAPLEERLSATTSRLSELRRSVADLQVVAAAAPGSSGPASRLQTGKHRQEWVQLSNELRENQVREERAARELERARALHARELVSQAELEERQFQLVQLREERALLVERARSGWQAALAAARTELKEAESVQGQLREERALYTVTSPVDGTVEEVASVSPGSFLPSGHRLAVISPTSDLVAEVYVTPRDIGLLRQGTPVRMQIDAFNYNDWGFVTGRVAEISEDFFTVNQQPMFRVTVQMDGTELALRNGVRRSLRKGMTLRARFTITERSLFQLLRDDVNDWLNPSQSGLAATP